MAKQTNATIYYCDKCRKAVIGTPRIIKNAEYFGIAPQISTNLGIQDDTVFFPNEINKFYDLDLQTFGEHFNPETNTADGFMEVESKTKYLCKECAKNITEKYIELANQINELFKCQKK